MQWHGFRIPIVLLALIVGLTVLLGGQWAYNKYNYQKPLEQALEEVDTVADYSINEDDGVLVIKLKLSNPDNLMEEYQKISNIVRRIVNERAFRIDLIDNPDSALQEAYYNSQFVIHEAIIRGNFREMADVVHNSAEAVRGRAKIYVGSRNIYLQMEHGNHYLYKVISRNDRNPGMYSVTAGEGINYD